MNIQNLVITVLTTMGGTTIVLAGLFAFLGKILLARLTESEKANHAREIEVLKSTLEYNRSRELRNSDAQFKLYSEVWSHLQDVKSFGDRLWERASLNDTNAFVQVLSNARIAANRGRLILNEDHYQQLQLLFEEFENYQIGKMKLIEIRSKQQIDEIYRDFSEFDISEQIRQNHDHKKRYESLLDKIVLEFRKQLALTS